MERTQFMVYNIGSSTGLAVVTNTSIPGRLELPSPDSHFCFRASRSGMLLMGFTLGNWLRSQEKPNQTSPATDNPQSQMISEILFFRRHMKKRMIATSRAKINILFMNGHKVRLNVLKSS